MTTVPPVTHPEPTMSSRRHERLSAVLRALAHSPTVDVRGLSSELGVSAATLRRDLAVLEAERLIVRTHGGARVHESAAELPVAYRDGEHRDAKARIARAAVARLPHGPLVVGLTGGTTTAAVAHELAGRSALTVVTNALTIAVALAARPQIKVVVTGGIVRSHSSELVGGWAEGTLRTVNIGVAIVGVDGIDAAGGLTTHDEVEARTNATMIGQSQRVIVVADGSKIGQVRLAQMAELAGVDELITDSSVDPAALAALRERGLAVHVA